MDFNSWIENTFADMTWKETLAAIAVCITTLIALEIFYWSPALRAADTAPKQDPKYIANYENLLLKHSDQRLAWRPNISTETFNIAWISGSSAILRNKNRLFDNKTRYTLPLLLSQHIKTIDGRDVKIYDYTMSGGMSVANLIRTAHAVDSLKPDFIVLAINPFWIMQDRRLVNYTFHSKGHLLSEIVLSARAMGLASFLSPMNVFTSVLQAHASSIELRHLGRRWLQKKVNLLSIYMPRPKKVKRNNISVISDWIRVSGVNHGIQSEDRVRQYQTNAMMMDKPNVEGMGAMLLETTIDRLGTSGIPTLVYMAPTDPALRADDLAATRMDEITAAVQSVVDQKSYDNLHFDAASSHMLDSASFRDLLHLKNESSMLTFFTDHMERILEADVTTTSIASRFSRVQE